jgi:prepilin-type N-terminal cleavage/methylation domain-containing protein
MSDQRGFTLIELLVAMAVFSFLLLIIVVGFMNIVSVHNAAVASNQAQDSARAAMDELVQAVRNSEGAVTPIPTGVAPGITGALGGNFAVLCLNSNSGGPKEYFVASLSGGPNQLFERDGAGCSATAVSASDTPLTSTDNAVTYFGVQQYTDTSKQGWKPELQITLALGSSNGTTNGNGLSNQCNANTADRQYCSTVTLTSGASPR